MYIPKLSAIGMVISSKDIERISKLIKVFSIVIIIAILGVLFVYERAYQKVVQIDIIRNRELIKESYDYWNDIIHEIEIFPEDEVIITRVCEPGWTPYFLYSGLPDGYLFEVEPEAVYCSESIMPNV